MPVNVRSSSLEVKPYRCAIAVTVAMAALSSPLPMRDSSPFAASFELTVIICFSRASTFASSVMVPCSMPSNTASMM